MKWFRERQLRSSVADPHFTEEPTVEKQYFTINTVHHHSVRYDTIRVAKVIQHAHIIYVEILAFLTGIYIYIQAHNISRGYLKEKKSSSSYVDHPGLFYTGELP